MKNRFPNTGWISHVILLLGVTARGAGPATPDPFNVVWTSPSTNLWGTMPIGNGDLALNAWVEPGGDLRFYLAKSDAWDSHARLLKLGLVRLHLTPNPFEAGAPFRQELRLREGEIEIRAGAGDRATTLRIWADANAPLVRIEGESGTALSVQCSIEPWRTAERALSAAEASGADTFEKGGPVISYPDVVADVGVSALAWYHRNPKSIWESTLRHQGLERWIREGHDPLLNRTFGGWIEGDGFRRDGLRQLTNSEPRQRFQLLLHAYTAQVPDPLVWLVRMRQHVAQLGAVKWDEARAAHRNWWGSFWERSWVRLSAPDAKDAEQVERVNRGYVLQRFLNACASRGDFPIKFNGSLFTVPPPGAFDADYRQWGGCYWFQNTRLPYWPMLASGDLDLMEPLFRMYQAALPLAKARTRIQFDHDGAYFSETGHFWGAWHNGDLGWGWDREKEPPNRSLNQYIRFHWSGGIELLAMMLDRYSFQPDPGFLRGTLMPHADAVLEFYARHYPRQPNGRILFAPAQSLETWWETENPTPEVAGLHFVLDQLLAMNGDGVDAAHRKAWQLLKRELPPIPRRTEEGRTFVLPAEAFRTKQNSENPELYAVFPFRVFGVGRPELAVGVETFRRRGVKGNVGWQQDETQAAFLGLATEARTMLADRVSRKHPESRFPAFWGPNFDWIPDQDHGGNTLMALQTMVLQHEGDHIRLLPAWPKEWNVEFRLHAPHQTVVEGSVRDGRLVSFKTTPASRQKDVEVGDGWR